jgi:hypothetical protein
MPEPPLDVEANPSPSHDPDRLRSLAALLLRLVREDCGQVEDAPAKSEIHEEGGKV